MGKSILGRFGIAIALIAEIALFAVCSPYFFSSENFLNVSLQISITAIIAVGMTLVILTAGIDLSVGALVAFTGVVATSILKLDVPYPVALALCIFGGMLVGVLSGAIAGIFTTKFNITPFIVTLALMTIWRGASYMVTDGRPVWGLPETDHKG